jgi:cytochrome P450 family 109
VTTVEGAPGEQPAQDWSALTQDVPALFREYARLREECPVPYSREFGGFWTLTRYADVRRAATRTKMFRNGRPFLMDVAGQRFVPESLNPPEHTSYRRMLNPHFTPARMATLEPTVRAYVAQHLRSILDTGGGDFIAEVAHSLPTRVLCAFLNLPDELWPDLKAMTRERTLASGDAERTQTATGRFLKQIHELITQRREAPLDPDMDMVTALLQGEVDGRPLSDDEIAEVTYQVIIAGADTTSATLGSAVYLICANPAQQARLRADPSLVPNAVEEVLRLEPALHYMGRTVAGGVCVHDRMLADGDAVALNFASANRDPARFADPDVFDVTRTPNPHLTFGHGIHKCVGAPLARLELRVVLEELLGRTRVLEFAGEPERGSVFPSTFKTIPIHITPHP